MPGIYRRAALHAAYLDDEVYGVDICRGEVDWNDATSEAADDLRALLSFLRRDPPQMSIARMLMASGKLPPLDAAEHAKTIQRAMEEVRQLLTDQGTSKFATQRGLEVGRRVLIDTHCHFDRFRDPSALAAKCEDERIFAVAVTNIPSHYELAKKHLHGLKFVMPAVGLHPLAIKDCEHELPLMLQLIPKTEFIGEIGLDFSKDGFAFKTRR